MREEKFIYLVDKKFKNKTILQFFKNFFVGKDKINFWFCNSKVCVNGEVITNRNYLLKENDKIYLENTNEIVELYDKNIEIVYEDKNILVVNKPSKILVHSDGITNKTLLNAVSYYLKKKGVNSFAYPIHRIDYDTTGIVMFAKDPLTLSFLSVSIEKNDLIKEYVCLCQGPFEMLEGTINKKIGKDRHSNKQIITKNGQEAMTKYKVIKNGNIAKVKIIIIHGRKHQIRVHMNSIGHSIVGDKLYGINDGKSLKLHFKKITFFHPFKNKRITIECEEKF